MASTPLTLFSLPKIPSAYGYLFVNNLADEVQWYLRGCGTLQRGGKSWGVSDRAKRAACLSESVPVSLFYWVSGLVSSLGHVCSPNSQEDPARQKETQRLFNG